MTNLTGANRNLMVQVAEYTNHMATKDSAMATMQKNNQSASRENNPPEEQAIGPGQQENGWKTV